MVLSKAKRKVEDKMVNTIKIHCDQVKQ
jgi:hypothetical protein